MIVLSNTTAQTIQPGESAVLGAIVQRSGCDVMYQGSGSVHLKCGLYGLSFTGNVSGDDGTQPNLAIAVDGVTLPETRMAATIEMDTDVFNVHASTLMKNCYSGSVVTVKNVGTTAVTLAANPALVIERKG